MGNAFDYEIDDELLIYHFALEPDCKETADRSKGCRNARVYFLVGNSE